MCYNGVVIVPFFLEGGRYTVDDVQWVIVVNAASYRDMEVFVWGMMQAEQRGRRFLFRTAASFVKVRGGIPDRGLLVADELRSPGGDEAMGGLTTVGSYVQRTTDQLDQALGLDGTVGLELRVAQVLSKRCREEIQQVQRLVEKGLNEGHDVVLYTSRELHVPPA